jgi:hypothetical protein
MYLDDKREGEATAPALSWNDFIAWLETKPADEVYSWSAPHCCPAGQYSAARSGNWADRTYRDGEYAIFVRISDLAYAYPRTFGVLLARAKEARDVR